MAALERGGSLDRLKIRSFAESSEWIRMRKSTRDHTKSYEKRQNYG